VDITKSSFYIKDLNNNNKLKDLYDKIKHIVLRCHEENNTLNKQDNNKWYNDRIVNKWMMLNSDDAGNSTGYDVVPSEDMPEFCSNDTTIKSLNEFFCSNANWYKRVVGLLWLYRKGFIDKYSDILETGPDLVYPRDPDPNGEIQQRPIIDLMKEELINYNEELGKQLSGLMIEYPELSKVDFEVERLALVNSSIKTWIDRIKEVYPGKTGQDIIEKIIGIRSRYVMRFKSEKNSLIKDFLAKYKLMTYNYCVSAGKDFEAILRNILSSDSFYQIHADYYNDLVIK
jgi:hypothetical protein